MSFIAIWLIFIDTLPTISIGMIIQMAVVCIVPVNSSAWASIIAPHNNK